MKYLYLFAALLSIGVFGSKASAEANTGITLTTTTLSGGPGPATYTLTWTGNLYVNSADTFPVNPLIIVTVQPRHSV